MKDRKTNFKQSLILTVIALAVWGCGGSNGGGIIGSAQTAFKHLTSRASAGSHIYKPSGNVNAMALVGFAAAPSNLQQSFQGKCTFTADTRTIPTDNIMPLVLDRGDDQNCNFSFQAPNATLGSLVIEDGTVGTLVVVADSSSAQNLVCKDLTNSAPVTDGQFISVWFRPSDNSVLLFSNTSQAPTTCKLPIPAGDAVTRVSAQFLKS